MPPLRRQAAPVNNTGAPVNAYQGGPYASAFQDATNAQSAMAREDFQQDVGGAVGGLNAIGALRSGRASVTLDNASRTFGRQIGNIAAANAGELARLNQSTAEGEANRSVQREGMAMQDRQFGARLSFDQQRAGRSDFESDRTFGANEDQRTRDNTYRSDRASRSDMESDRSFGENQRQYNEDSAYRTGRATRADMESDRTFGANEDQRSRDNTYRTDRANRSDMESDRSFGFNQDRAKRSDFESDRGYTYQQGRDAIGDQRDQRNFDQSVKESDRNFGEGQRQFNVQTDAQRTAARQAGQAAAWGTALGNVDKIGGAVSKVGGAVKGVMSGAKTGAAIGSVVPGLGTAVGGVVGGVVGGLKKLFKW